jgi:hypothetical protein
MLVPQDIIIQLLGENPALYALAGLTLLIVIDLALKVWLANKSKTDSVDFKLLPDFIQPTLTSIIFIIVMEVLVVGGKGLPGLSQFFTGLEILGFAAILLKYFTKIKEKLKLLGMEIDESVERQMDNKVDQIDSSVDTQSPPILTNRPEESER